MPNGGQICCHYCTYNTGIRTAKYFDICDIWGIECTPYIICRAFRMQKQSHSDARKQWPLLNKLKPGIVYSINNNSMDKHTGEIDELYRLQSIDDKQD